MAYFPYICSKTFHVEHNVDVWHTIPLPKGKFYLLTPSISAHYFIVSDIVSFRPWPDKEVSLLWRRAIPCSLSTCQNGCLPSLHPSFSSGSGWKQFSAELGLERSFANAPAISPFNPFAQLVAGTTGVNKALRTKDVHTSFAITCPVSSPALLQTACFFKC